MEAAGESHSRRNVLITGASAGIGRQLAIAYATRGDNVALLARRMDKLEEVAAQCSKLGVTAVPVRCDITDRPGCHQAVEEAVKKLGPLSILILNAGMSQGCYFEDIVDLSDADYLLKLNIIGQVNILHFALPHISKSSTSRIMAVSSVAGCAGVPFRSVYCASKWGLNGFCHALRQELQMAYGKQAPQVVITCPPEVATDLNAGRLQFGAGTPAQFSLKVAMDPADVAQGMVAATERGERQYLFSLKFRLLVRLARLLPATIEKITIKSVKKTTIHPRCEKVTPSGPPSELGRWTAAGKTVLITGASSGIGRDLALGFARAGANLALVARRKARLEELAKECAAFGVTALPIPCDVTDTAACKEAVATAVRKFEHLSVVILNAGVVQGCFFEDMKDLGDVDYMIRLNILGQVNILHYALPHVPKKSDSRIVSVSSVAGCFSFPFRTIYCASKWGLEGFFNSLRAELNDTYGPDAPKVVVTCPPKVGTDLGKRQLRFGAVGEPVASAGEFVMPCSVAADAIRSAIANGTRQHLFNIYLIIVYKLYGLFPSAFDSMFVRRIRKTHQHPRLQ